MAWIRPKYVRGLSLEERFWRWVDRTDGCWYWRGAHRGDPDRYGSFYVGGDRKMEQAHRVAYRLARGLIPDGMLVCHHCDEPLCVRPDHLFLGTALDNARDRDRKQRRRAVRGEAHALARLRDAEVCEIRALHERGATVHGLSRAFDVSRPHIHRILRGEVRVHGAA